MLCHHMIIFFLSVQKNPWQVKTRLTLVLITCQSDGVKGMISHVTSAVYRG